MYADVAAEIEALLGTDTSIRQVLDREPKAIAVYPVAYHLYVGMQRAYAGNSVQVTYQTRVRILIPTEDASVAALVTGYVNSIPALLDSEDRSVSSGAAGFFDVADRQCRALDFTIETRESLTLGEG